MTAITPLETIHKKGIFGNHQKKEEKELLRVSEVKNLSIVQVVQYKNSKIELKGLKIDGLNFPIKNSSVIDPFFCTFIIPGLRKVIIEI